jgi:hypothetical protein
MNFSDNVFSGVEIKLKETTFSIHLWFQGLEGFIGDRCSLWPDRGRVCPPPALRIRGMLYDAAACRHSIYL